MQPSYTQEIIATDNTHQHFESQMDNHHGVAPTFLGAGMIDNTEAKAKECEQIFFNVSQCSSPIMVEDLPNNLDLEPDVFSHSGEIKIDGNTATSYMPDANSTSINSLLEPVADVLDSIFEEIGDESSDLLQWTDPCTSTIAV